MIQHTIAVGVVVIGMAGSLAMIGYRLAMECVDPRCVPVRLAGRASWWGSRVSSLLRASALLFVVGVVGLFVT